MLSFNVKPQFIPKLKASAQKLNLSFFRPSKAA